jgi:hypothetical protein
MPARKRLESEPDLLKGWQQIAVDFLRVFHANFLLHLAQLLKSRDTSDQSRRAH